MCNNKNNARKKSYRLLTLRPQSEQEMRRKLNNSGFGQSVTEEVIFELKGKKLIDDEHYARNLVRRRLTSKPVGKEFLRAELRYKGVNREIIEEALLEYDDDKEFEMALSVAKKKIKHQNKGSVNWNKTASFLMRRGFSFDIVNRVYNILVNVDGLDIS